MKKADKNESRMRTEQIRDWLLEGLLHWRICENARQMWDISEAQVYRYMQKSYALLEKERDPQDHHRRYAIRFDMLKKALAEGDHDLALKIIQDLDKLEGYYVQNPDSHAHVCVDFDFEIVDGPNKGKFQSPETSS
jgi:hypothetical protein